MSLHLVPDDIRQDYEIHEWRNALAVLRGAHETEWNDLLEVLREFHFTAKEVLEGGGSKSKMARRLDEGFGARGWKEKSFDVQIMVDGKVYEAPTHKVDFYKNRVAVEVEWSNKDPFFDRDLNNFRLLFDLRAIDVGIIITKSDELAEIFRELDVWDKYGWSTTWMRKLLPRLNGGGGGGCPILVIGIRKSRFIDNR
ncbi:restriction endonuclease [Thermaerobacter sp. FW80]|uniref:BglII/BstYI family type II restriction endonuclease n=1 Tax=Thermaerobacter sp. FW80 TaxID=2546351 RepID=UPI001074AC83|nr:BglII/BstYI family type II restriction endonuclease [Thermaerobacter sp. FW80]QBS36914.1 restriction endonuclease [Thermaerobacter sp. FW80]